MWAATLYAQTTEYYSSAWKEFRLGKEYYEAGLYSQAFSAFEHAIGILEPVNEPQYSLFLRDAALGKAQSALRMGHPEGEKMMVDFIAASRPDPVSNTATLALADFYFNASNHEKAIAYYGTLRSIEMKPDALSEARFKQGYSYFVRKEFTAAESVLGEVRELKTVYYYPVNYYYGMCKFFKEDYTAALKSFEKVSQSEKYRDYVPYYITQIYFAQGDYAQTISYAEPRIAHAGVKNKEDIRLLLGRAYFESGSYEEALPYLSGYASQATTMRAEDFYQLGFAQYQAGNYPEAEKNFKQVAAQENTLGQRANFYLADCYLKTGDRQSARTAFRNVAKMTYDEALREEALLQFGKVSADLNYDADAIKALDAIPPASPWYAEAQEALRDVFYHTQDYRTALSTLESFPTLSPTLKEAYQQISLYRGIQLMQDGMLPESDQCFAQIQTYPISSAVSAQGLFWRAEIAHRQGAYEKSADYLRQFFTLAKSAGKLPDESSVALANYTQGYNYLRLKNYLVAQGYFVEAISLLKQEKSPTSMQVTKLTLPDAMVRAGDCAFKRNQYEDAHRLYAEAIPMGGTHMVYAKYQRAMIEGLQRRPEAKIRQLEDIVSAHPESSLADDALLQLGVTCQEINRNDKAVSALQRLVDKYPNSELLISALLRLGLIHYNNGEVQAALTHYKRVFTHQPSVSEGREALSAIEEIYIQDLKKPDAYFDFLNTVPGYELTLLKKDSVSYHVAEIQYERSEYPAAIKAFSEYIQKFPQGINFTAAHFYRGDAHAILKQYSEALRDFELVVEKGQSVHYIDALHRAALLAYHHTMDFAKAYAYYVKLQELVTDPEKRIDAELGCVRSAFRAGRMAETRQWSGSLVRNVFVSDVARSEAHFYGARAAYTLNEYEEALAGFEQVAAMSQNEQAAESRYRIAQIYFIVGQFDIAEQACHSANEKNANYAYWVAKSLILLSDIAVGKKDLFNAKAPLEAVIENFQGDTEITQEAKQKLEHILTLEHQQSKIQLDTGRTMQLQIIEDEKNN